MDRLGMPAGPGMQKKISKNEFEMVDIFAHLKQEYILKEVYRSKLYLKNK